MHGSRCRFQVPVPVWGGAGGVNRFSDLANILHWFSDLINTADCGFI